MGQELSSMIQTGLIVTVLAALIVLILNLMSIAQGFVTKGINPLEQGVQRISEQEFEKYNQKKMSGTSVKIALSLYQGQDVGIIVRTKGCPTTIGGHMYGTLLQSSSGTTPASKTYADSGLAYTVATNFLTADAGSGTYKAEYYLQNNMPQSCTNLQGTTATGNAQFIRDSALFNANLIRNGNGVTIGIYFDQISE